MLSDHPLVVEALVALLLFANLPQRLVQVRAEGHHHGGDGAAHQHVVAVGHLEIALPIVAVAHVPQRAPGLLERDLAHAAQHVRADLGSPVGQALPRPFGRQADDGLRIIEKHAIASDPVGRNVVVRSARCPCPAGCRRR